MPYLRINYIALAAFSLYLCGCSAPSVANYSQLHSFTKEEKIIKSGFGSKKKTMIIKDFRENDNFEENITALKENVEKYILEHAGLNDTAKNNLRELKVTEGQTNAEVELLLGKPDKIEKQEKTSEVWIYKINKMNTFNVLIIPVFLSHEGYYLYFKDNILAKIKRNFVKQVIQQTPGSGLFERVKKEGEE